MLGNLFQDRINADGGVLDEAKLLVLRRESRISNYLQGVADVMIKFGYRSCPSLRDLTAIIVVTPEYECHTKTDDQVLEDIGPEWRDMEASIEQVRHSDTQHRPEQSHPYDSKDIGTSHL